MAGDRDLEFTTGLDTTGAQRDLDKFTSQATQQRKIKLYGTVDQAELKQSFALLEEAQGKFRLEKPKKDIQEYMMELRKAREELISLQSVYRDLQSISQKALSSKMKGGALDDLNRVAIDLAENFEKVSNRAIEAQRGIDGIRAAEAKRRQDARDQAWLERELAKEAQQRARQKLADDREVERLLQQERRQFAQEWRAAEAADRREERARQAEIREFEKARHRSVMDEQRIAASLSREKQKHLSEEEAWHRKIEQAIKRQESATKAAIRAQEQSEKAAAKQAQNEQDKLYGRQMAPLGGMSLFFGLMGAKQATNEIFEAFGSLENKGVSTFQNVTDSMITMGQAGSSIGAMLGPKGAFIGALVGGVGGIVTGVFKTAKQEAEKTVKAIDDLSKGIDKFRERYEFLEETIRGKGFKSANISAQKFLDDFIDTKKVTEETIKKTEQYIETLAKAEGLTNKQYVERNKDSLEVKKLLALYAMSDKFILDGNEKIRGSIDAMKMTSREAIDAAKKELSEAVASVERKNELAKVSTADLQKKFDELKGSVNGSVTALQGYKDELIKVVELAYKGDWNAALSTLFSLGKMTEEELAKGRQAAKELLEVDAELDKRKKGRKGSGEKYIGFQNDLDEAAWKASMKATEKTEFPLLNKEFRDLIAARKKELLEFAEFVETLNTREGESRKDYHARMVEEYKKATGKTKDVTKEEVDQWIKLQKEKLEALEETLSGTLTIAEKEQEAEQKKRDYERRLAEEKMREVIAYKKMMFELFKAELSEMERVFSDSLSQDKIPKWYKLPADFVTEKEREAQLLQEQYETRAAIMRQSAKDAKELYDIEIQLMRDKSKVEEQLIQYRKQLMEQYTSDYAKLLQPMVDVTASVAEHIGKNITNEKRAFEGLPTAINKAVGQVLKEKARLWLGNAAEQGAAALASLAIGDFPGAGLHGAAAAGYLAAAALAGYAGAKLTPKEESEPSTGKNRPGSQDLRDEFRTREMAPVTVYMTGPGGTLVIPASDPRALAGFGEFVQSATNAALAANQG